jgi:hypothetical protein
MSVEATQNTVIRSYRLDGIAAQAMRIAGIYYDMYRPGADGVVVHETPSEALMRMGKIITSCTEIGNVGHAMLRGVGFDLGQTRSNGVMFI